MTTFNYDHIVVRYGELSTKGKNRKDFTKALTNNIKKRLGLIRDYLIVLYMMAYILN